MAISARSAELMAETALLTTLDEGGGYHDSGYIHPLPAIGDLFDLFHFDRRGDGDQDRDR